PRFEGLAWHRDHRVEQDEKINSAPGADDRRGEATHRRGDEDDISTVTDCVDESIRVLRPAGLVVLGWQPNRNRMVATGSQLGDEPMPLPWVAPPPGISAYVAIALSRQRSTPAASVSTSAGERAGIPAQKTCGA